VLHWVGLGALDTVAAHARITAVTSAVIGFSHLMARSSDARVAAPERIVIASRESALAMWQAQHIQSRLVELYPGADVAIFGMTTEGDRRLGVPLAQIGGKGLFVKELEDALLAGRADLAVHSLRMCQ
jgi:hydroxymethylbilane synthase